MIEERQRRLMERVRTRSYALDEAPVGSRWVAGTREIASCGDRVSLYINRRSDTIAEARYIATGCSLAVASAELVCEALQGCSLQRAGTQLTVWRAYLSGADSTGITNEMDLPTTLRDLGVVRDYPARRRCALLAVECALEIISSSQS